MQHPDEGTIHSWLDGALSVEEVARVEAHLKDCSQCAAAVAEARGFIAASSRILSALDNAPRGVIPAAKPVKRVDPMVWRIAATLLVVAAGTLVVVQNNGGSARFQASSVDSARLTDRSGAEAAITAAAPAPPSAQSSEISTATQGAAREPAAQDQAGKSVGNSTGAAAQTAAAKSRVETAGGRLELAEDGDAARRDKSIAAADAAAAPAQAVPTSPPPVTARFGNVMAMSRAPESDSLRVIATPRRLGAKVTVYQVGADTVTLTESQHLELQSVVVTGATTVAQATGKAAAAEGRAAPMAAQPVDTQTRVPVPAPPPPVVLRGAVGGVSPRDSLAIRRISWADSAGNTFTLEGRMSEARLQQLRLRIERERAAAKRNP